MFKPDFNTFRKLAEQGNLIPVYREFMADMETPVSVLSRFADERDVFLLESVEGGERFGRYSFIGINPRAIYTIENGRPFLTDAAGKRELEIVGNAFFTLRELLASEKAVAVPGLPPLFGGAVGYLGYECVNLFEKLPAPKYDSAENLEAAFMLTDEMIIFDNVRHIAMISVCARVDEFADLRDAYDNAVSRIEALRDRMKSFARNHSSCTPRQSMQPRGNMTRSEFTAMVEKAKEYIADGEIIQAVLSQKFTAPLTVAPFHIYRALRLINPSPYTFFLKTAGRILIGSSPETMVKLTDGVAALRPIAGTRKRGADELEDRKNADELLKDEKERAEHLMLVDLGRNDLGRIAAPGSVQVRDFMKVERYSHVMHLVSNVEAIAAPGIDAFDLVRATFPAGTLSGAPKIRAMQIINELEPAARGPYGGAVGYLSNTGNLDLAITIRTLVIENNRISIQAGAGIVYDSDPDKEYDETINKAAAVFKALQLAANGLTL
ncbi:Anthranilate synthase component 1 [bioreactor metagenome]|uniref:Anthranilate synthase component 1 n=1 Tax=bioreactor metagenome TaxID=1076179 RepID=A0A644ZHU6_9ZZZZ